MTVLPVGDLKQWDPVCTVADAVLTRVVVADSGGILAPVDADLVTAVRRHHVFLSISEVLVRHVLLTAWLVPPGHKQASAQTPTNHMTTLVSSGLVIGQQL